MGTTWGGIGPILTMTSQLGQSLKSVSNPTGEWWSPNSDRLAVFLAITYLQHIHKVTVMDLWKLDFVLWVANGLEFHHRVGDGLERRLAVRDVVEDTPQRPHVALAVYLKNTTKGWWVGKKPIRNVLKTIETISNR